MCPVCLANLALLAVGATSAGGAAAFVVKKIRAKNDAKNTNPETQTGEEQNENQNRTESGQ